jgi:broad specificity phosphatase PhoE
MTNPATIYIVRHGETVYNTQGVIQGYHGDSSLTPQGIEQAESLRLEFKDMHFDAAFSSDLLRARRTAEIITLERQLIINTTQLLRERNYGRYEGGPTKIFKEENKEIMAKLKDLTLAERRKVKFAPDVESDDELATRLITFIREIAATYASKTILVVSHGGIMRAFLNHLAWGGSKDLESGSIKNTAYIKLESDGVEFLVTSTRGVELPV